MSCGCNNNMWTGCGCNGTVQYAPPACNPNFPTTCAPLGSINSGSRVVVEDQQYCKYTLANPVSTTTQYLAYDPSTSLISWTTINIPLPVGDNILVTATNSITPRTLANRFADSTNALDFGLSASNTAAQNLTALKAAVAATPSGGVLVIPDQPSFYLIDTTGGLSTAVEINKTMEIVLQGNLKANSGLTSPSTNPPYIFNVTASGVTISGSGSLIGNGTFDTSNAGVEPPVQMGGLIYVAADNFTASGITIDSPNKVGIYLYSCSFARITNCTFIGGPTTYVTGNTAYFGIRTYQGEGHLISNNQCIVNSSGGRYIDFIFFAGTDNCVINGNVVNSTWEKVSYIYGNGNTVSNNQYMAPDGGNITDAFRFVGSYNTLIGNTTYGAKGGTQVFNGVGNQIIGNSFVNCTQIGILVADADSGSVGLNNTKIIGNTVIGGIGSKSDGIRVFARYKSADDIVISNNYVNSMCNTNTDEGLIRAYAYTGLSLNKVVISNNVLGVGINGIYLYRVANGTISNNILSTISNYAFVESTGSGSNSFLNNKATVLTNIGINNLQTANASYGSGNQYSTDAIVKNINGLCVTTASAASTTVTNGGVADNAKILFFPVDGGSSNLTQVKGTPYGAVSGTNFTINFNSGTSVTAQTFYYQIIQ